MASRIIARLFAWLESIEAEQRRRRVLCQRYRRPKGYHKGEAFYETHNRVLTRAWYN